MQRRGARRPPVKSRRTKQPKAARKAPATHSSVDHAQEQLVERLKRERDEAVELQAASAEVLKIIGSSPGDMKPVFEAMLGRALRICDAKFGHILLYDGERFHAVHLHDVPPSYRAFWDRHGPIRPGPNTLPARPSMPTSPRANQATANSPVQTTQPRKALERDPPPSSPTLEAHGNDPGTGKATKARF